MATRIALVGGVSVSLCIAAGAAADITSFGVGYQINYVQAEPEGVRVDWCTFFVGIDCEPGDIGGAKVSPEGAAFQLGMIEIGPGRFRQGFTYDLPISMESQFPSGNYRFEVQGGLIGEGMGTVVVPAPLHYPSAIPEFDPSQFVEHGAIDPHAPHTFRFNTFTSTAPTRSTSLVITSTTGEEVFRAFPAAGENEITVPARTLRFHNSYSVSLNFSSEIQTPNAAFNGATAIAHCGYSTRIGVQTIDGCEADFNGDGFLDFFDLDEFVVAFENGDPRADFNGDGFLDFFDMDGYVVEFQGGC